MKNITLITSVIDTPNIPLSYTPTRSVFTKEIRFEQLKKTISTIREKIPDNRIILIECSLLSEDERQYLTNAVDYFLNIYDTDDQLLI
jgi:RecG-like helicase